MVPVKKQDKRGENGTVPDAGSGIPRTGHIRAVLFDMDNTLFDFVDAQITACRAAARLLGERDEESLYPYFCDSARGYESSANILDFIRDRGITKQGSYEAARRVYEQEKIRRISPYPGVFETLTGIRELGLPMGIITDAHSRDAVLRLKKAGLRHFFAGMVTFDRVRVKKPAPEPFLAALVMLGSPADGVLLIGDSPWRDIEPGRLLGLRTVYARYGDRFSGDRPVPADYTIDAITELLPIIRSLPRDRTAER